MFFHKVLHNALSPAHCVPESTLELTITLSSSYAGALRPLDRPLCSAMDVSEGVVTLELAEEFLVEGAIQPTVKGPTLGSRLE